MEGILSGVFGAACTIDIQLDADKTRKTAPLCSKNFAAVFKAKLWCLEMSILSRFWRVLGDWFMECGSACPCQFGTDLALIE